MVTSMTPRRRPLRPSCLRIPRQRLSIARALIRHPRLLVAAGIRLVALKGLYYAMGRQQIGERRQRVTHHTGQMKVGL